jgi:hypothetical protein
VRNEMREKEEKKEEEREEKRPERRGVKLMEEDIRGGEMSRDEKKRCE